MRSADHEFLRRDRGVRGASRSVRRAPRALRGRPIQREGRRGTEARQHAWTQSREDELFLRSACSATLRFRSVAFTAGGSSGRCDGLRVSEAHSLEPRIERLGSRSERRGEIDHTQRGETPRNRSPPARLDPRREDALFLISVLGNTPFPIRRVHGGGSCRRRHGLRVSLAPGLGARMEARPVGVRPDDASDIVSPSRAKSDRRSNSATRAEAEPRSRFSDRRRRAAGWRDGICPSPPKHAQPGP